MFRFGKGDPPHVRLSLVNEAPASTTLIVSLEPRRDGALGKVLRFVGHFLSTITGTADLSPDADLVVRRRSTGVEVHRTPADTGDPERILDTAKNDLEALTEEEFFAEWSIQR
jgi:hypothetical protein